MSEWMQFKTHCLASEASAIEDCLLELGAVAVTLQDVQDIPIFEPDLGTTPLWPNTQVTGLFSAEYSSEALKTEFYQLWPTEPPLPIHCELLEDKDWAHCWMDHYHPLKFGPDFWVVPSWLAPPEPNAPYILLDPGLAFGTGTHETTALCLEWLSQQPLHNSTLIDYGCGSGILAVAGLKLGCQTAYGIDIDPQALLASQQNAQLNHVSLHTLMPEQLPAELCCDYLIANILYGPLLALAPTLAQHLLPGGRIALSGLLKEQAETIRHTYQSWFILDLEWHRNDWCLLSGTRRITTMIDDL